MKIFISILSGLMVILTGCAFLQQQKIYPFPSDEVTVIGYTIYCADKPFAKLWTIDSKYYMQDKLFSDQAVYGGGLAIHYYDTYKDVWIHPKEGLSVYHDGKEYTQIEDMQRVWSNIRQEAREYYNKGLGIYPQEKLPSIHIGGRRMEKEDLIRSHVFDVRISQDGKYVYFKSDGILWNSSHKYLVEYGVSE